MDANSPQVTDQRAVQWRSKEKIGGREKKNIGESGHNKGVTLGVQIQINLRAIFFLKYKDLYSGSLRDALKAT